MSTREVDGDSVNTTNQFYGASRVTEADKARFYKRLGEMEALRAPPASV